MLILCLAHRSGDAEVFELEVFEFIFKGFNLRDNAFSSLE